MTRADDARTRTWVQRRLPAWQQLDSRLPALESDSPVDAATALDVVGQYPEIARDLAIAGSAAPGGRVTGFLEQAYARLHRVLFRRPRAPLAERLTHLANELPAVTAEIAGHLVVVTTGLLLAGAAGWWLVETFPELIALVASEQMIETVQRGGLWTDGLLNVMPSALLSVSILTNNIIVALTTLCLGLLYGLGTLYIIGLNGFMLGGVLAYTAQHGLGWRLLEFVCAHGLVELTVICIAGAIGLYLGESLARPGHRTRITALQQRANRVGGLVAVCVVFLVGAGFIEGYVSPDPSFPWSVRLAVGLGYLALLLLVLSGFRPLGARRAAPTSDAAL